MPSNKPAGSASDHARRSSSKDADDDEIPTHTLWVGNLSSDTVDPDLMALFSKHGALDCTTMHGSRSYAFVYFKHLDDARAAKGALQGAKVHGNTIRIEFARPAKSCKHLWIGGISSSFTKEQLEDEFLKFGKIEECRFSRDRNSALIDYYKIEDAVAAQKNMNGKRLAGEQIHVDFLRSQPSRRDWPDHHDSRDGHFSNRRSMGPPQPPIPPGSHHGSKRHLSYGERRGEGQPTNVLWIGYPPSVRIDEELLHNSMILFGEIERIKSFPSRHYSFVEFRSIDEARRAKEGLQGRLFGDPRIQILFSSSDLTPNKDNSPPFPGFRGPGADIFLNEVPVGPLELFGPGRSVAPNINNFPGPLATNGMPGSNILLRPFASQGFDPHHGGLDFPEFGSALHNVPPDGNFSNPMPPNWRRHSPARGLLPSPPGIRPSFGGLPGAWDRFDAREPKRSRLGSSPPYDAPFHSRRSDPVGIGDPFGFSHPERGALDQRQHSPVARRHDEGRAPDYDCCWRGIIAKGGSHVCHARCVPIGNGIHAPFPEVVNCAARTGLDMLTKHYAEADGFDIVFFLPDSEEDFASYTEFLRYLGLKDRAGVAKLDDGTTLFLVPPSDFLTKVLNVSGPERLYGVVLKLPQQSATATMQQPQQALPPAPSRYMDQPQLTSSLKGYNFDPQNEDQTLMDYTRSMHEGSVSGACVGKPLLTNTDEPHATHSASERNPTASPHVQVSLTPELIATLASLIPTNSQSMATGTVQMPPSSSLRLASSTKVMNDGSMPLQGRIQTEQVKYAGTTVEQLSYPPQQLGHQLGNQAFTSQLPVHANILNRPDHSAQQVQDPSFPQALAVPTMPLNNYVIPSQSGQFSAPQNNHHYQLDSSFASHNSYGMSNITDTAAAYNPPVHQQMVPPTSSAQGQTENLPMPPHMDFPSQGQPLLSLLTGSGQSTSEGDADKNQRYQSTLQFAASLLHQIQQQQQASSQAMQGSGKQQ